jgi:hypothetical protein
MCVSPDIEINQQEVPDVKKAYFKPSITALPSQPLFRQEGGGQSAEWSFRSREALEKWNTFDRPCLHLSEKKQDASSNATILWQIWYKKCIVLVRGVVTTLQGYRDLSTRSQHNKSATCVQRFGLQFSLVRQRQK